MKKEQLLLLTGVCLLISSLAYTQSDKDCNPHPLFTMMPNHSIRYCEKKEFNNLVIYKSEKNGQTSEAEKGGEYLKVTYKYDKDWNNRPACAQIYQNYINAIQKEKGEVLYKSASYLHASLKKNGSVYWIVIICDGSGDYTLETIREEAMRQDILLSPEEIRKELGSEGKLAFYNIYFDTDKATLQPASAPAIKSIADFLKANPSVVVYIVGHTDNAGTYEHNISLSKNRALSVINELTSKHAVPARQLSAEGVGPLSPVASNKTEEGKARNRRVELVLK